MGAKSQQPGVDGPLADRALRALLKHHASSADGKDQLLGSDLDVQVQFTLAKVPGNAGPKPIRIEIPHPLVKVVTSSSNDDEEEEYLEDIDACLIVKEESKPWVQDLVAKFPTELKCIKKVLGLQSLRTKHKSFAQRRALLDRYDVFFADDRILPMLTKALGGKFFDKKKQPIPVALTRKEALPFAIQKNLRSTFMHLSAGTCVTVKAGSTAMPPAKLLANIQAVCAVVPTKVPAGKWGNVQAIAIKTTDSAALPIYNKTPRELEEIRRMAREEAKTATERDVVEEKGGRPEGKKRKKAAGTPLAKALKRQKAVEEEDNDEARRVEKSSKKKKRKGSIDEDKEKVKTAKTPQSSKKKRKESIDDILEPKTPKSKKKRAKAEDITAGTEKTPKKASDEPDADFIASKKFKGAKKGYVFSSNKRGTGYYKDVLPKVDKAWLASLGKRGGGGGGRKSMGGAMRRKKGGRSRRSY